MIARWLEAREEGRSDEGNAALQQQGRMSAAQAPCALPRQGMALCNVAKLDIWTSSLQVLLLTGVAQWQQLGLSLDLQKAPNAWARAPLRHGASRGALCWVPG